MPLTAWKGRPIYLATILALAALVSMVLTEILGAASRGAIPGRLIFTFANMVDHRWVWTPLTYVLVNPFGIGLLLASYMLWMFGEAVEQHLGRRVFVKLLLGSLLITPLLLTLIAIFGPRDWPAIGIMGLEFGVFIAFATLYPRARLSMIICTVDACVLATIFVGAFAAVDLLNRNWASLFVLAGQVLFAYAFVRYEQGHWTLPSLPLFKGGASPPAPPVDREPVRRKARAQAGAGKGVSVDDQVDTILEKIHRHGLQSLTDEERRIMQQASDSLRKGDR